jgi:hypothetical protein
MTQTQFSGITQKQSSTDYADYADSSFQNTKIALFQNAQILLFNSSVALVVVGSNWPVQNPGFELGCFAVFELLPGSNTTVRSSTQVNVGV